MFNVARRQYQALTSRVYLTGFDKVLYDKLRWLKFDGHFFALLGVANLVGYGLSHIMKPENYRYYFAYTGREARFL
jgi:hypothetical protein